jgi:hypothetical protein
LEAALARGVPREYLEEDDEPQVLRGARGLSSGLRPPPPIDKNPGGGATILRVRERRPDRRVLDRAVTRCCSAPESACSRAWDAGRVAWSRFRAEPTQRVTHLTYAVRERNGLDLGLPPPKSPAAHTLS